MIKTKLIFTLLLAALSLTLKAQSAAEDPSASITEKINATNNISVTHPGALELRMFPRETAVNPDPAAPGDTLAAPQRQITPVGQGRKMGGYRVQVFSDNNARTAKSEAEGKKHAVANAFPQYPTYVIYTSPYWRLKVGDFRTHDEAEAVATEIKRAFPAYAREIRVVRDRINVPMR